MLSESLALSFTALLVGTLLRLWRAPTYRSTLLVLAAAVLWLFTRQNHLVLSLREHVAHTIGPIAKPKTVLFTEDLPKTRSGKILRGTMKKIAEGQPYTVPATIDDPAVLHDIQATLQKR